MLVTALGQVYTPFNLPAGFVPGQKFNAHACHFETERVHLKGRLRKMHSDGEKLVSDVWNFLREVIGRTKFDLLVIFNVVPWAAAENADKDGQDILGDVSADDLAKIAALQAELLRALGDCEVLTSSGGAAEAWFKHTGMADLFGMGPANSQCVRAAGRRPIAADLRARGGIGPLWPDAWAGALIRRPSSSMHRRTATLNTSPGSPTCTAALLMPAKCCEPGWGLAMLRGAWRSTTAACSVVRPPVSLSLLFAERVSYLIVQWAVCLVARWVCG